MKGSRDLVERIRQADSPVLPDMATDAMMLLVEQLYALVLQNQTLNRRRLAGHRQYHASQKSATITGVGELMS